MSRNGSGTYTLPAGNPVVSGTTITTSWANTTLTDIASSLTGSVAADGQTPMTGALNMANNKVSAVTDPTLAQDAATKNYTDTAITTATSGLGATYLAKANNLSDVANATTSRTNLIAAKSGANSDITSLTGLTTPLTVAQGGIGAATLTANNVLLGNGTSAPQFVAPSTSGNVLTSNGTTWTSAAGSYQLTSGTAVASTSGTSIDFTSIPSWVKRIIVMLNGVSTNGSSNKMLQIGTTSGLETSGYAGTTGNGGGGASVSSTGFNLDQSLAATFASAGIATISLVGSNIWIFSCSIGYSAGTSTAVAIGGATKTLAGTLDRIRITTVNGTDTFDAGSINILYE